MNIAIISFTPIGRETAGRIAEQLRKQEYFIAQTVKCAGMKDSYEGSLKNWTKEQFRTQDAIVFVGAVGIAVRAIAPYIVSKKVDPAVVVIDERANYCIPILSGHIGGANELTQIISGGVGAVPVITTATDINQKWAVDVFATKNDLHIGNMEQAKYVSASLLQGQKLCLVIGEEGTFMGNIPDGLELSRISVKADVGKVTPRDDMQTQDAMKVSGIYIGPYVIRDSRILSLIPKCIILGIGCKKGTDEALIRQAVQEVLKKENIHPEAVSLVTSIDLKAKEKGLLAYCEHQCVPFQTYPAEELQAVEGEFTTSTFVGQITGVDNVCERSAICAGGDRLLVRKTAGQGVTVAVAIKNWEVRF